MSRRAAMTLEQDAWWVNVSATTAARYFANYETLAEAVVSWKAHGRSVALAMGTFDLLHLGHVLFLEKAKTYADLLVVGIDSDAKARSRKGQDRPVLPERDRVHRVAHLRHVDAVVIKPTDLPRWELIRFVLPNVLVAGAQTYTDDELRQLEELCGQIMLIPRFPGLRPSADDAPHEPTEPQDGRREPAR